MNPNQRRVLNTPTSWYVVNIKARENQTSQHYVDAFNYLHEEDPAIKLPRGNNVMSMASMTLSELLEADGQPKWIKLSLMKYTVIDPEAFYNRRSRENISLAWDSDVVANKKDIELYFYPSVHSVAFRANDPISLQNVLVYFTEALKKYELNGFDVTPVVDHEVIAQILSAHSLLCLEASISFSNPGESTSRFQDLFEARIRESNSGTFFTRLKGSVAVPLSKAYDSLIAAIINLSERNGSVKATIKEQANSKSRVINTASHPLKLTIPRIVEDVCSTIYDELRDRYGHED